MPDQFATDALFDAVRHGCLQSVRRAAAAGANVNAMG